MAGSDVSASIIEQSVQNQCTNVKYPQVQGLKNESVQNQINEMIKRQVFSLIPEQGCDVYQEILGIYRITLNEKGILSIRFEVYTFPIHAANGLTVVKSLTFNLATGEAYQLHDLFRINSDYKIVITKMIQQQIRERDLPLIKEFRGITDYQDFYLTENSLVIYFQEIEYTPHYVGIPEFAIPYSKIINLIRKDGPIARLIS